MKNTMHFVLPFIILGSMGTPTSSLKKAAEYLPAPRAVITMFNETSSAMPQSCTVQSLLDTSNCDQTWSNYKSGYEACVRDAAKHFWKEYSCSDDALRKLQYSCRDCEKRFKK